MWWETNRTAILSQKYQTLRTQINSLPALTPVPMLDMFFLWNILQRGSWLAVKMLRSRLQSTVWQAQRAATVFSGASSSHLRFQHTEVQKKPDIPVIIKHKEYADPNHPNSHKAALIVRVEDLPLSARARERLIDIVGCRFNKNKNSILLTSNK
jgi:hypothetical protein